MSSAPQHQADRLWIQRKNPERNKGSSAAAGVGTRKRPATATAPPLVPRQEEGQLADNGRRLFSSGPRSLTLRAKYQAAGTPEGLVASFLPSYATSEQMRVGVLCVNSETLLILFLALSTTFKTLLHAGDSHFYYIFSTSTRLSRSDARGNADSFQNFSTTSTTEKKRM